MCWYAAVWPNSRACVTSIWQLWRAAPKLCEPKEPMTDASPPTTLIPTRWVGPIRISGNAAQGEFEVPLATYETPLWPSVGRGARVSRMVEGGIRATVVDERMSRSVLFTAESAADAYAAAGQIARRFDDLAAVVEGGSKYA